MSVNVSVNIAETKVTFPGRGFRQRCCLSPTLFNKQGKYLADTGVEDLKDFEVRRRNIETIRYVNDVLLIKHRGIASKNGGSNRDYRQRIFK